MGSNIHQISLKRENQLDNENLGVGSDTWLCIAEFEEEHDTKPNFTAVRNFFVASLKKMLQKFPFGDSR